MMRLIINKTVINFNRFELKKGMPRRGEPRGSVPNAGTCDFK